MELMLDFQNEIFTKVATAVRAKHKGASVTGEYVRKPSTFPAVALDEIENVTVDELVDSSDMEKYSGLRYRLQVFSNKVGGKKAEARAIFATADQELCGLGFRRVTYSTTPEIYDSTIYSISATYEAIASADGFIYKR
jgi:hypothetical protein